VQKSPKGFFWNFWNYIAQNDKIQKKYYIIEIFKIHLYVR